MINAYILFIVNVCLFVVSSNSYGTTQWKIWYKKDNLIVKYRLGDRGLYTLSVSAFYANTSSNALINAMYDTDKITQWLSGSQKVTLLSQPTPAETMVLTIFKAPWPVKNRHMVTSSCLQKTSENQYKLLVKDEPKEFSMDQSIQVKPITAYWLLKDTEDGLYIEHQVYANPNGSIPSWLVNKMSLKRIKKTFIALKEVLQNQEYKEKNNMSYTLECDGY